MDVDRRRRGHRLPGEGAIDVQVHFAATGMGGTWPVLVTDPAIGVNALVDRQGGRSE